MTVRELFAVFYAVLFGAMLSSLRGFVAFPWGQALSSLSYRKEPPPRRNKYRYLARLLLSIVILNLLPILMFAGYFRLFGGKVETDQFPLWQVMLIALSALGVYAPYRLWHAVITSSFFSDFFYLSAELYELMKYRKMYPWSIHRSDLRKRIEDKEMCSLSISHLFAAVFYAGASLGFAVWVSCSL